MRVRVRVLVLLVAASIAALSAQAPSLTSAFAELDTYAAREYAQDPVGSLLVGVVTDAGLAWSKGYGFADAEARRPPTDQTPYRMGSITKQFVGLMLLQLVERGKVRLSDPLVKYVPEFSAVKSPYPDAPPVTLVQLATMTSGLAREPSGDFDHSTGSSAKWEQIVLGVLPRVTYAHEPGTKDLVLQHRLRAAWPRPRPSGGPAFHRVRARAHPPAAWNVEERVRRERAGATPSRARV